MSLDSIAKSSYATIGGGMNALTLLALVHLHGISTTPAFTSHALALVILPTSGDENGIPEDL